VLPEECVDGVVILTQEPLGNSGQRRRITNEVHLPGPDLDLVDLVTTRRGWAPPITRHTTTVLEHGSSRRTGREKPDHVAVREPDSTASSASGHSSGEDRSGRAGAARSPGSSSGEVSIAP
jgi:hypothetical protein